MLQTLDLNFSALDKELVAFGKARPELNPSRGTVPKALALACKLRSRCKQNLAGFRMWAPKVPLRKPVLPQLRLPDRLRTGIPSTVLHRRRTNTNAGLSGVGAELQVGVQHIADSIRSRLLGLRTRLQKFHDELGLIAEVARLSSTSASVGR
jgi:hypothetical protein